MTQWLVLHWKQHAVKFQSRGFTGLLDWAIKNKKDRMNFFFWLQDGKTLDSVIQPPKQNIQNSTVVVVNPHEWDSTKGIYDTRPSPDVQSSETGWWSNFLNGWGFLATCWEVINLTVCISCGSLVRAVKLYQSCMSDWEYVVLGYDDVSGLFTFAANYTRFQWYMHGWHLPTRYVKHLLLTVKLTISPVISKQMTCIKLLLTEEDCALCMFPNLRDNSNVFCLVTWLLAVTSAAWSIEGCNL